MDIVAITAYLLIKGYTIDGVRYEYAFITPSFKECESARIKWLEEAKELERKFKQNAQPYAECEPQVET